MAGWNNDFSHFLINNRGLLNIVDGVVYKSINNRVNFGEISDKLFDAPAVAFLTIEEFNPWSFMT